MIVAYHKYGKPTRVSGAKIIKFADRMTDMLFLLAGKYPEELIVWCDEDYADHLNIDSFHEIFHHKKILASYCPGGNYFPDAIGYSEESSFVKVNKSVVFPTWQMSGAVGGISAEVLNSLSDQIARNSDFDYFLTSMAKLAMPLGLFCYSAPELLLDNPLICTKQASVFQLFRFVSQHYKFRWALLLLLNFAIYDKRFPIVSCLLSAFYRRRKLHSKSLDKIIVNSSHNIPEPNIDVIIPTIGRREYLYDFLKGLSHQTILPKSVIIVEQNPLPDSTSELNYLTQEWPFHIDHTFTHQTGACNARNIALEKVASDWIFLADDDIRIKPDFFDSAFNQMRRLGGEVYNFSCLQPGQKPVYSHVHQTSIFGSGCSIISKRSLGDSRFDMAFEFGFSEDLEFARQLLDKGYDTTYLISPEIIHLKAPIGGFRTKPKLAWDDDPVQPKPSPTVMLYKLMHHTREQLLGYRTMLLIKFYSKQKIKNPMSYLRDFRRRWARSIHYANLLRERNP